MTKEELTYCTKILTQHLKSDQQAWKAVLLMSMMLFATGVAWAEGDTLSSRVDSLPPSKRIIHQIGVDLRPSYVFPTNSFLRGDNWKNQRINNSLAAHLKYSFRFHPDTATDHIYGGAYQGIGVGYGAFHNTEELGDPTMLYIFQGARIARLNPRLTLDYEWHLGLSFGWSPYDYYENYYNRVIGSRVNAYMSTDFFLRWAVNTQFDLITGVSLDHFSNGNTKFPNSGLNTIGLKLGMVYNINRREDALKPAARQFHIPEFPRHISYDVVLFGSWRRKGVVNGEGKVASPKAYMVGGFNFTPMYNLNYKLRVGMSLDGVYDGSANVYTNGYHTGSEDEFITPPLGNQLALGLSARGEYVMPYFTVGVGIGANVVHGGGDLKGIYQVVSLKMELTRNSFLHIGYNLQNFKDPNYLMLGIGFRFHNRYPTCHR